MIHNLTVETTICWVVSCYFLLCSAGQAQILSPPAEPIDAQASQPIRRLLNEDWERSPKIAVRSKTTFESERRFTDDLLVAYMFNRIRHSQTGEAKLTAQELTARHTDNLDGWMVKTWLNTLTDDFEIALINMRNFKKQIDAQKNLPEKTRQQIFSRLGRLIGYFQGPVASRVNDDLLNDTVRELAVGLKPEILKIFNENRDRVLKRHGDLLAEQGKRTQVILDKTQLENQAQAAQLERQNQLLEQTEAQLLPQKQKITEDATKEITAVQQQASQLDQRLSQLTSDISAVELDLQYLYQDLDLILSQPPQLRQSTFFLRNRIRNAELSLASLHRNAVGTSNQLNGLRAQISQIEASANRQTNEIDQEIKRLNGSKLRNLSKLTKINQGPKLASGKRKAMISRATALRTYDDLTLELYRQDMLSHLSK